MSGVFVRCAARRCVLNVGLEEAICVLCLRLDRMHQDGGNAMDVCHVALFAGGVNFICVSLPMSWGVV